MLIPTELTWSQLPDVVAFALISFIAFRLYRSVVTKCIIRTLPGPVAASWLKGNLAQVFDPLGINFHLDIPKLYGSAVKIFGLLGDEYIYFNDPAALQQIVIREQNIFDETPMFIEANRLIFGKGLLGTLGPDHRRQRKILNPVFSETHIRGLYPTIQRIGRQLGRLLKVKSDRSDNGVVDMRELIARTALEVIGQGGIGHSFNALEEDETKMHPMGNAIRDIVPKMFATQIERNFLPFVVGIGPAWFRRFCIRFYPNQAVQDLKDMSDVLWNSSREILQEHRTRYVADGTYDKAHGEKDIISVLLQANSAAAEEERLSEDEVLGQMATFLYAATDTTSSGLSRVLHNLALNRGAQERLREEISQAKRKRELLYGENDLPYDELMSLPWLDAVCRETLRLHCPVTFQLRTCRKATTVRLSRPVLLTDGKTATSIPVAKNQKVVVGVAQANSDKGIWGDDAEEWKPERWLVLTNSEEGVGFQAARNLDANDPHTAVRTKTPQTASQAKLPGVYSGMMTFWGGHRACIGFRFAQLEMKALLVMLIESYRFEVTNSEIIWRVGNVATPTIKGDEYGPPQMPLKVSLV